MAGKLICEFVVTTKSGLKPLCGKEATCLVTFKRKADGWEMTGPRCHNCYLNTFPEWEIVKIVQYPNGIEK